MKDPSLSPQDNWHPSPYYYCLLVSPGQMFRGQSISAVKIEGKGDQRSWDSPVIGALSSLLTNLLHEDFQPAKSSVNHAVSLVKFCSSQWCCTQFRIDMRIVVLKRDVSILIGEIGRKSLIQQHMSDHQQQSMHLRGTLS